MGVVEVEREESYGGVLQVFLEGRAKKIGERLGGEALRRREDSEGLGKEGFGKMEGDGGDVKVGVWVVGILGGIESIEHFCEWR